MNSRSKMHILHLEDESPLRDVLRVALLSAQPDLQIAQFIDSGSAVEYLDQHIQDIDLHILDIRVPGELNGLEVAGYIRQKEPTVPIVVTSAYLKPEKELLQSLQLEWIAKPWHIVDIQRKLLNLAR